MIQKFYTHLEQFPDDWDTRSVFADWLQENDNILEKAQKFLIKKKKYAAKLIVMNIPSYVFCYLPRNKKNHYSLRLSLFVKMRKDRLFKYQNEWLKKATLFSYSNSLQEAEEKLAKAL